MEDLTLSELLNGLKNPSFNEHKLVLLQIMANKFAETDEGDIEIDKLIEYCLLEIEQNYQKISENSKQLTNYTVLVLQNMTSYECNSKEFLNIITETNEKYNDNIYHKWTILLESFLNYNPSLNEQHYPPTSSSSSTDIILTTNDEKNTFWILNDPLQNLSFVLCNLSQHEEYRDVFLKKRSLLYLPKLLNQIKSKNAQRRGGVAGTLRNCLFDKEYHVWICEDLKILSYILPPLVVPISFTEKEKKGMNPMIFMLAENEKKRPDEEYAIIEMLLDCILLLCQTRFIRHILRRDKIFPICRNLIIYLSSILQKNGSNSSDTTRVNDIFQSIVKSLQQDDDVIELERQQDELIRLQQENESSSLLLNTTPSPLQQQQQAHAQIQQSQQQEQQDDFVISDNNSNNNMTISNS